MKIASIIAESLLKAGGYEIFTYNLLNMLSKAGHDVTLYVPDREFNKHRSFYSTRDFAVRPLMWKYMSVFKRIPAISDWWLKREQRSRQYDLWQVMGAYPEAAMVQGLAGLVPLVLRTHGDDIQAVPELNYGLRLDPVKDQAIRKAVQAMDTVITLTPGVEEDLRDLDVDTKKTATIPNGINCEYLARKRNVATCRKKWGIPDNTFLLLSVGRNHPKKGFDLIPAIASGLNDAGLDFHWLVVGKGTDAIQPELLKRGLNDRVQTIPSIGTASADSKRDQTHVPGEELVEVYAMSDLFVFPSRVETFGRVLIEAMAAGTPVVTTDALGCRDVVEMGKWGKMVSVDDVPAMIKTIQSLADSPDAIQRLTQAGLERASQHDWPTIVDQYVTLYEKILGKK